MERGGSQRNSLKTTPVRLYLANTGLDVCYDGFCAAGNQFPVLITKTRSVGRRSACQSVVYFALSRHHSSTYHYQRTSTLPNNEPAPVYGSSPSIQNTERFYISPTFNYDVNRHRYFPQFAVDSAVIESITG